MVYYLYERPQCCRSILHLNNLGIFQNVPPLPVSMVGSYEMLEYRLVVMNQTANGHRRPFEHYRIPKVIVEHGFTTFYFGRFGAEYHFLAIGKVLFCFFIEYCGVEHFTSGLH